MVSGHRRAYACSERSEPRIDDNAPDRLDIDATLSGIKTELRAPQYPVWDLIMFAWLWVAAAPAQCAISVAGGMSEEAAVAALAITLGMYAIPLFYLLMRAARWGRTELEITETRFRFRVKLGPFSRDWVELPMHSVEPYSEAYHLWVRDTRDGTVYKVGQETKDVLRWLDQWIDIQAACAPLPHEGEIPEEVQKLRGKMERDG